MLTAIKGTYENGQIILDETPSVRERTEVIVTFLDGEDQVAGDAHTASEVGQLPNSMKGVRLGR